ncbi:MAG: urea transporter [Candidatus Micrarchaeota archaeon]
MKPVDYAHIVLRGFGQVMLQNNIWTGILFLVGILANSGLMAFAAILGNITGSLAAYILKYDRRQILDGLYGFNGTLVGIAGAVFFQPSLLLTASIMVFSAISTVAMHFMLGRGWKPFTFPFVASAWAMVAAGSVIGLKAVAAAPNAALAFDVVSAAGMSVGQVMFQASVITGAAFLLGLAASSWLAAAAGLASGMIGSLTGLLMGLPVQSVNLGIYGFNAVLCGIALSDGKKSAKFTLLAIALAVALTQGFILTGIPALTAPFVFAAWIALAAREMRHGA